MPFLAFSPQKLARVALDDRTAPHGLWGHSHSLPGTYMRTDILSTLSYGLRVLNNVPTHVSYADAEQRFISVASNIQWPASSPWSSTGPTRFFYGTTTYRRALMDPEAPVCQPFTTAISRKQDRCASFSEVSWPSSEAKRVDPIENADCTPEGVAAVNECLDFSTGARGGFYVTKLRRFAEMRTAGIMCCGGPDSGDTETRPNMDIDTMIGEFRLDYKTMLETLKVRQFAPTRRGYGEWMDVVRSCRGGDSSLLDDYDAVEGPFLLDATDIDWNRAHDQRPGRFKRPIAAGHQLCLISLRAHSLFCAAISTPPANSHLHRCIKRLDAARLSN
jgi:hypothetical protein